MKKLFLILFVLFGLNSSVFADGHVKRILSTSQTGMGKDIVYPSGKAKITAFEFTVPVGGPVVPHTHSFPVLIMIQQGEIELTQGGKSYVYNGGDAFIEDVGVALSQKILEMFLLKQLLLLWVLKAKKL